MRTTYILLLLISIGTIAGAQMSAPPPAANAQANTSASILPDLDRLQAAAAQANLDISHMRIEKWKTDGDNKHQAQSNADSLQRNLTSALPGLIDGFKASPQDLAAGFKLYRNLNALYDVLVSFTESAGAFGPKNEYEALAQQVNIMDSVRRDLADNLERLTSLTEGELNQLRLQVKAMQQQQAAAAEAPPKKVVVDNSEAPKKKTTHHKKTSSSTSTSGTSSQDKPADPSNTKSP